jgi:hypothetical protein
MNTNFIKNNFIYRFVAKKLSDVERYFDTRYNKKEVKQLTADITSKYLNTIKILLQNQQAYFDSQHINPLPRGLVNQKKVSKKTSKSEHRTHRNLYLRITKKALLALEPTFELVGVQPLLGPVGLSYTLQYTPKETKNVEPPTELTASELDEQPPEPIRLEVISSAIEARSRQLQAGWTTEALQVVRAAMPKELDFENEIITALSTEIAYDISEELVNNLVTIATKNNPVEVSVELTDSANEKISIALTRSSLNIAKGTRRGMGNFILTTPSGLVNLESLNGMVKFEAVKDYKLGSGVAYVGNLVAAGRITHRVYCSVSSALTSLTPTTPPEDTIIESPYLIGYKGSSGEIDTGFIYAPYVFLIDAGIMANPNTFQPIQRFATRSGIKIIENASAYYSIVKISLKKPDIKKLLEEATNKQDQ